MRKLLALTVLASSIGFVSADLPTKVLTFPHSPPREVLDRLNLELGWKLALPVEGRRDGIATLKNLGDQLFVQLRNGTLFAIDAKTGAVLWSKHIGPSYPITRKVGNNEDQVFVTYGNRVVSLDRATGQQRWDLELEESPIAEPMGGEFLLFIPLTDGRVNTYALPETTERVLGKSVQDRQKIADKVDRFREKLDQIAPKTGSGSRTSSPGADARTTSTTDEAKRTTTEAVLSRGKFMTRTFTPEEIKALAARPYFLSSRSLGFRVDHPVMTSPYGLVISGSHNETLFLRLDPRNPYFKFVGETPLAMQPVRFENMVYFVTEDGLVTAVDLEAGFSLWRYAGGATVNSTPIVTADSVFVSTSRNGLVRIDRAKGAAVWVNHAVTHCLAVNASFVYGTDRFGRLVVLNRTSGAELSSFDASRYNVLMPNQRTDRLIMIANDGSIISLHDKSQVTPLDLQAPLSSQPTVMDVLKSRAKAAGNEGK